TPYPIRGVDNTFRFIIAPLHKKKYALDHVLKNFSIHKHISIAQKKIML
ncbi:hypothetical protein AAUPMG_07663, partial [Pasteurella multocida subsp. multocida str. Anand1_goat]